MILPGHEDVAGMEAAEDEEMDGPLPLEDVYKRQRL